MIRAFGVALGIAKTRPIVGVFFATRRFSPQEFWNGVLAGIHAYPLGSGSVDLLLGIGIPTEPAIALLKQRMKKRNSGSGSPQKDTFRHLCARSVSFIVVASLLGHSWKLLAAGCYNYLEYLFLNFRSRRIRYLEYLFLNFRSRRIRYLEYLFLNFRSRRILYLRSSAERSRRLMSFAFRSILRRHCRILKMNLFPS
jgi:hypothetical protein